MFSRFIISNSKNLQREVQRLGAGFCLAGGLFLPAESLLILLMLERSWRALSDCDFV